MDRQNLEKRLLELRQKQEKIDHAWGKTGNKQLLEFFVDLIPKTLQAERCSIFILDSSSDNVWLTCGTELSERQVKVPLGESMVGQVIASGSWQVEDCMENRVGSHEYVDMQTGFMSRNAICVPVFGVTQNIVTGAIQVLNKKGLSSFNESDKDILEKLAIQVQVNIENLFLKQQWLKISEDMERTIKTMERKIFNQGAA